VTSSRSIGRDTGTVLRGAMTSSVVALLFVTGACAKDTASTARAPKQPPLVTGGIAPVYSATSLSGAQVEFGGATGSLTLVNVWATWCRSCKEEFAELERIRIAHEPAGLHVVAVSVDQGSSTKVQAFTTAQGSQFPVVHDHDAKISALYGVNGLPSTYLIGKDGKVLWALTGSFLEDSAAMYAAIRKATASSMAGDGPVADVAFDTRPRVPLQFASQNTVSLLGYSAAVPKGWTSRTPSSSMRLAEFVAATPASTTSPGAEVIVYFFGPSQGGSVEANLARWKAQFSSPTGEAVKEVVTTETKGTFPLTIAEYRGTYARGIGAGSGADAARPNHALIAVVAETPKGTLFFQLFGPVASVEAQRAAYLAFVRGLR